MSDRDFFELLVGTVLIAVGLAVVISCGWDPWLYALSPGWIEAARIGVMNRTKRR
jgi:hypothetical protein